MSLPRRSPARRVPVPESYSSHSLCAPAGGPSHGASVTDSRHGRMGRQSNRAVTQRRHRQPSHAAVTQRRHTQPSRSSVRLRRHTEPSQTAVTQRRHTQPSRHARRPVSLRAEVHLTHLSQRALNIVHTVPCDLSQLCSLYFYRHHSHCPPVPCRVIYQIDHSSTL